MSLTGDERLGSQCNIGHVDQDVVIYRVVVADIALDVSRATGFDTVLILGLIGVVEVDYVGDVVITDRVVVHCLRRLACFGIRALIKGYATSSSTVNDIVFV